MQPHKTLSSFHMCVPEDLQRLRLDFLHSRLFIHAANSSSLSAGSQVLEMVQMIGARGGAWVDQMLHSCRCSYMTKCHKSLDLLGYFGISLYCQKLLDQFIWKETCCHCVNFTTSLISSASCTLFLLLLFESACHVSWLYLLLFNYNAWHTWSLYKVANRI